MATLVVQAPVRTSRSPSPGNLIIDPNKIKSIVPNKHIPYCSPGPIPKETPVTPPASPDSDELPTSSILYPLSKHRKLQDGPRIYGIGADTLKEAIEEVSTRPLSDPQLVFPWLHGLHPENHIQQAFFTARRKGLRQIPRCLRSLTIVKCRDIAKSRLRGAIETHEILDSTGNEDASFLELDPKEGFSVRNFHIQIVKMATVSDIIVYKDDCTKFDVLKRTAIRIANAQKKYRETAQAAGIDIGEFNTFVLTCPFEDIEDEYPELVAVCAKGKHNPTTPDLLQLERQEMCTMSKASEISHNVWLGPTPDSTILPLLEEDEDLPDFDICIEASDLARAPDAMTLRKIANACGRQKIEFPSSGSIMPPTWSHNEVDSLLEMCRWIYQLANPEIEEDDPMSDEDGDIQMKSLPPPAKKIFLHCGDGYTETTLLAVTYFMYAECLPLHEAWIRLHRDEERNFFAYPSDVSLLTAIQPRIMQESPKGNGGIPSFVPTDPLWLKRMDGSLPSRILSYMYLGNLSHANNPELLKVLGIKRVLSVGEPVSWSKDKLENWGAENFLFVDCIQDNGVDPLTDEIQRCLEFLGKQIPVLSIYSTDKLLQRKENKTVAPLLFIVG